MSKVINLGPLSQWFLCESGKSIDLPGQRRNVRIALICAGRAPVAVTDLSVGTMTIIGYVEGLQEFVFGVQGHCQVSVDSEADVYYRTDDGDVTCVEYDNEPFVTSMERRVRNPQLEYLMYLQEQNQEKRNRQMLDAMSAQLARMERNNGNAENSGAAAGGDSSPPAGAAAADASGNAPVAKPAGGPAAASGGAEGSAGGASADPKPGLPENGKV